MSAGPATGRVVDASFSPSADRRSVLDRAHRGDIEGALGSVKAFDTGPRLSLGRRLGTLLAIMGPGLIVMAADNDAGTFSVYAQAGQDYGLRLLWPFIVVATVIRTIDALKSFDVIYVITVGGPGSASTTINILLYQQAFSYYHLGFASAVVVVFFALILAISYALLVARQQARWQ